MKCETCISNQNKCVVGKVCQFYKPKNQDKLQQKLDTAIECYQRMNDVTADAEGFVLYPLYAVGIRILSGIETAAKAVEKDITVSSGLKTFSYCGVTFWEMEGER